MPKLPTGPNGGPLQTGFLAYLVDRWNAIERGCALGQPYQAADTEQMTAVLKRMGKYNQQTGRVYIGPAFLNPRRTDGQFAIWDVAQGSPYATAFFQGTLLWYRRPVRNGCTRDDVIDKSTCKHKCPYHPHTGLRHPDARIGPKALCRLSGIATWLCVHKGLFYVRTDIPVWTIVRGVGIQTGPDLLTLLLSSLFPGQDPTAQRERFQQCFQWNDRERWKLFS